MTLLRRLLEAIRRWLARRESLAATNPPTTFSHAERARLVTAVPREDPRPPAVTAAPPIPSVTLPAWRLVDLHPFVGPLGILPLGQSGRVIMLGDPGVGRGVVDPTWERANLVVATGLPGRWNGGKGRLYVHRKVEPYVREALRRCELLGVLGYISRFGCFNFRHMRHDVDMPLSTHAWAAGVDVNSDDNAGKYIASPPRPWSDAWKALWPLGVPEALVHAFESCGWTWGGRWRGYVDPMHFQIGK